MNNIRPLMAILRCPQCQGGKLEFEDNGQMLSCNTCVTRFPLTDGRPVLLRQDNEVFRLDDYLGAGLKAPEIMYRGWERFIPTPSINLAREQVLARLKQLLNQKTSSAKVLVVGCGQQRKCLNAHLGSKDSMQVVYSDIDVDADVDLFCDGHDLPFVDCSFDAVITTAVLEHVLYPERVTVEIARVLKTGGLLYSELPFMQQVHEGAYDFTRYTLAGHRRLLNQFAEIEGGMVAGPATAFVWALENLGLAFSSRPFTRKVVKSLVRIGFGWIKYFDYFLVNRPEAMDGASCTYFLGAKIEERIADSEIISRYVGAKHIRHV